MEIANFFRLCNSYTALSRIFSIRIKINNRDFLLKNASTNKFQEIFNKWQWNVVTLLCFYKKLLLGILIWLIVSFVFRGKELCIIYYVWVFVLLRLWCLFVCENTIKNKNKWYLFCRAKSKAVSKKKYRNFETPLLRLARQNCFFNKKIHQDCLHSYQVIKNNTIRLVWNMIQTTRVPVVLWTESFLLW